MFTDFVANRLSLCSQLTGVLADSEADTLPAGQLQVGKVIAVLHVSVGLHTIHFPAIHFLAAHVHAVLFHAVHLSHFHRGRFFVII